VQSYDIIILDLVIPNRDNEDPESDGGLSLIEELAISKTLIRPAHIIGLTAYEDAKSISEKAFSQYLWHLIKYDAASTEWVDQLCHKISYIINSYRHILNGRLPLYDFDVAFLCALADPEMSALLRRPWNWNIRKVPGEKTIFHVGEISLSNNKIRVVAAVQPHMGNVSACSISERLIKNFRPKIMIMTGICGGTDPSSQNFLDLVVAEESILHDSGKLITRDGAIALLPDPKTIQVGSLVRSTMQDPRIKRGIMHTLSLEFGVSNPDLISIHFGPVASGNGVIATQDIIVSIRDRFRKLKGIEMEGYGFSFACSNSSDPAPEWMLVKSICDFADSLKADDYQSRAASISVRFAEEWIKLISEPPHSVFS
jgi:nucleoside phosphorylase